MTEQPYDDLPELLTVEEAARFIRVGRTKAYAMAREWRATGGRSGLPVVDFGHVLRVPRRALERLIVEALAGPTVGEAPQAPQAPREPSPLPATPSRVAEPGQRLPRHRSPSIAQPGLFEPPRAS